MYRWGTIVAPDYLNGAQDYDTELKNLPNKWMGVKNIFQKQISEGAIIRNEIRGISDYDSPTRRGNSGRTADLITTQTLPKTAYGLRTIRYSVFKNIFRLLLKYETYYYETRQRNNNEAVTCKMCKNI